jgi:hypothetical protein
MPTSPECYLLSSILRDRDFPVAMSRGITAQMFHAHPDEWDFVERYVKRNRKVPTRNAFKLKFPEFPIKPVNDSGYFADEVRKEHARYMLVSAMSDVTEFVASGDVDRAVKSIHSSVISIAAGMGVHQETSVKDGWLDVYKDVEERVARVADTGTAGIPTGFPTLDQRTGGAQPGEFWVVGARLGNAKTWTMLQWAAYAASLGYTVLFDSLEQSRVQIMMRLHSFMSKDMGKEMFSNISLQQGKDFDLKAYREFLKSLKDTIKGNVHVADASRGRVSPLTVASQIERLEPDIVFIDYITLMDTRGERDWRSIGQLSADLKGNAMEYGLPIVTASQLNRDAASGKEPGGAETISQADAIGQDADGVITQMLLSPSVLLSKLTKYRHGNGGFKWYSEFDPSHGVFREISFDKAEDLKARDKEAEAEARVAQTARPIGKKAIAKSPPGKRMILKSRGKGVV